MIQGLETSLSHCLTCLGGWGCPSRCLCVVFVKVSHLQMSLSIDHSVSQSSLSVSIFISLEVSQSVSHLCLCQSLSVRQSVKCSSSLEAQLIEYKKTETVMFKTKRMIPQPKRDHIRFPMNKHFLYPSLVGNWVSPIPLYTGCGRSTSQFRPEDCNTDNYVST